MRRGLRGLWEGGKGDEQRDPLRSDEHINRYTSAFIRYHAAKGCSYADHGKEKSI
jgi:hypothetical protein